MLHRRPMAIAATLLALVATLSACGFDYPTDRVNTIAAGANNRDADVDALGIRVLSTQAGEGRLIGALANNTTEEASLDSVADPDGTAQAAAFEAVTVQGRRSVNLSEDSNIALTGDFEAGDVINLELGFSTGESVTLSVPVVKNCWQYTAVPTPSAASTSASDDASADETASEEAGETASDEVGAAADEAGEEGHVGDGDSAVYDCVAEAPAEGEGH